MIYRGSCFCGGVRYAIRTPIKFVVHDHCSICRRTSGAPFVTWCGVKEEQFELTEGAGSLTTFRSSPEATRQFCKTCGSQLFFRSSRWPGEVHVTRATVNDEMSELPKAHVFFSDKASWLDVRDDLPRLGGPTGTEPLER